ncbi:shikimate transporter [compost metagenome]
MFILGSLAIVLFAPTFFQLLQTGQSGNITWAMVIAVGLIYGCLYGPQGSLFSSQFPPEVRYSGISRPFKCPAPSAAAWPPLIATSLLAYANGSPKYIVWYLSVLGVIAAVSALFMHGPERFNKVRQPIPIE